MQAEQSVIKTDGAKIFCIKFGYKTQLVTTKCEKDTKSKP